MDPALGGLLGAYVPWEPQLLEHTLVGLRHECVSPLH